MTELSRKQFVVLNWIVGVVIVSFVLPLGLVALSAGIAGDSLTRVVEHGELFLTAGTVTNTASVLLLAKRSDDLFNAVVAVLFAILLVSIPSYGVWSALVVRDNFHSGYDGRFVLGGGVVLLLISLIISFSFVVAASRSDG